MKTIRTTAFAGLALAASLALVGCAAGTTTQASGSSTDSCQELSTLVRDINNAAINTLAGDITSDVTGAQARFDGLIERAEALPKSADADADAVATLSKALTAANDYVATAPVTDAESAEATADAEKRATLGANIETAASDVKDSCTAK